MSSKYTMDRLIAHLTRMQIANFFAKCAPVTQAQCDEMAEGITGGSVSPTTLQGGGSYTVVSGETVVQFRLAKSALDIDFLANVEQAYAGFVPRHIDAGKLGDVFVYTMGNVGGVSMYLARDQLRENDCLRLKRALKDYARFFAMPWKNTPSEMKCPDRQLLLQEYSAQLSQLQEGLPQRFRPILDFLIPRLPGLFDDAWPLVPNHTDLLENNIHVDLDTGAITGVCDWKDAVISPFGMSLGWLETMLGFNKSIEEGWRYLPNQKALRAFFWDTFFSLTGDLTDEQKELIEVARLVGLFLEHGLEYDESENKVPVKEGNIELRYLDSVVLKN